MKVLLPPQLNFPPHVATLGYCVIRFVLHSDIWGPNMTSVISLIIFSSKLLSALSILYLVLPIN